MVKSSGVQRESEGVVVPLIGVQHNAPGGKGPYFDRACGEGKRQGMTGVSPSNYPGGLGSVDQVGSSAGVVGRGSPAKVRELQRRLWTAAKQSPERRFHALYDRVYRGDVLWEAWRRVRENRGAAGVDTVTLAFVEESYGVDRLLAKLQDDLREGVYRPAPARRRLIPKPAGGFRPLGIPTVRDRVAQQAAKLVLEPIFEADFLEVSYGFRPKRSATQAMERLRVGFTRGYEFVVEFDIKDFFGCIDHEALMVEVGRRVSDRRVLKLLRQWLQAGVMVEGGSVERTVAGTPQGGVVSPLLSNVFLHVLDRELVARGVGELVRYADDGVVLCRSAAQAQAALAAVGEILAGLGLDPDKTRVVDLRKGREGFDFLGCHFRARMSGRLWAQKRIMRFYLHRWPSPRSMKRLRGKVKDRTGHNRVGRDIRLVIEDLNPILRGWGNYFRTGNAADKFGQVDDYVAFRLKRLMVKKRGRNLHAGRSDAWTQDWFIGHGLYKLRGTVRYPKTA